MSSSSARWRCVLMVGTRYQPDSAAGSASTKKLRRSSVAAAGQSWRLFSSRATRRTLYASTLPRSTRASSSASAIVCARAAPGRRSRGTARRARAACSRRRCLRRLASACSIDHCHLLRRPRFFFGRCSPPTSSKLGTHVSRTIESAFLDGQTGCVHRTTELLRCHEE